MRTVATIIVFLLPLLAGCAAREGGGSGADAALLRLEYREQASTLPYLRLDGVQLQESSRLGRTSPVVWHFQKEELGEDFYLPLPDSYGMQDRMDESLADLLEAYGFALRGWPGGPQLLMGVKVKRLRLGSLGINEGSRSCELELEFILREAPAGLEITRFTVRGESRIDGSWTFFDRGGPRWIPDPDGADPVVEATRVAALHFLAESLNFWKDPSSWESSVHISEAVR